MKYFRFLLLLLFLPIFQVSSDNLERLESFYDEFMCEQKDELYEAGLTSPCQQSRHRNPIFFPPPNPLPPPIFPHLTGHLPVVIVNDSGAPDSEVYITVTGKNKADGSKLAYVEFGANAVGTVVNASLGPPPLEGSSYAKALTELLPSPGGYVFYLPYIESGLIWFSIRDKLTLTSVADPLQPGGIGIEQPNPTNTTDANYRTIWDIFEIDFESAGPVIYADATAVTQFNLPLYGYLSTPDATSRNNCGLYQPRSYILEQAIELLNNQPLSNIWNRLIVEGTPSYSNSSIIRYISPGKGIAAGTGSSNYFDKDYLDNAALGFSFIGAIWSDPGSFYRTNPLTMTVPIGSLETYTGTIQGDNTIKFVSSPSGYEVVFAAPTPPATIPTSTTTFNILSGLPLFTSDTSGQDDGTQLSKLFGEAIIAGFIPTATTISDPNVQSTKLIFYTNNPNLAYDTSTTGPWYDVYSKSLHRLGFIYTYAFDDAKALWPEVQIFATSGNVHPADPINPTYIGITIGPLDY